MPLPRKRRTTYRKTMMLDRMTHEEIGRLQPGQWVKSYPDDGPNALGRFWGVTQSGTIVVAWQGNARNRDSYAEYQKALRNYAIGGRKRNDTATE